MSLFNKVQSPRSGAELDGSHVNAYVDGYGPEIRTSVKAMERMLREFAPGYFTASAPEPTYVVDTAPAVEVADNMPTSAIEAAQNKVRKAYDLAA